MTARRSANERRPGPSAGIAMTPFRSIGQGCRQWERAPTPHGRYQPTIARCGAHRYPGPSPSFFFNPIRMTHPEGITGQLLGQTSEWRIRVGPAGEGSIVQLHADGDRSVRRKCGLGKAFEFLGRSEGTGKSLGALDRPEPSWYPTNP